MDDTQTSPDAPEEATTEQPLDDKDLGQAPSDTSVAPDGSEADSQAPLDGESQEETTDDETTSDPDEESGTADEDQLLTPEEIAKLDPKLKAQYRSMNQRFQERMRQAKELEQRLTQKPANAADGQPSGDTSPAASIVDDKLRARGIDPASIAPNVRAELELVADIALGAAEERSHKAVAPLLQKEAKGEIDAFFGANPERSKYRKQMTELDALAPGTLTLKQLYFAAAGEDLAASSTATKEKRLRDLSKANADSATGTPGRSPSGEGDIFDEIANAGGRGSTESRFLL